MDNYFLLIKYYQQKASEEEIAEVENWLSASDENCKKYSQYVLIWNASNKVDILKNTDLDFEWRKISKGVTIKQPSKFIEVPYWLRIAAVLLIFLGSFWIANDVLVQPKMLTVINESLNEIKTITLKDGTSIALNYKAKLTYPEKFKSNSRNVSLKGNAFFDVAKNPDKPFIISTSISNIEVLGTSFDVFDDKRSVKVTVKTGKVKVSDKLNNKNFTVLNPNEQAYVIHNKIEKNIINDENYLSWKTGVFRFNNTSLKDVFKILKTSFHITYIFDDEKLKNRELTAKFEKESLDNIIEVIQISCQVNIKKESNHLMIIMNEEN